MTITDIELKIFARQIILKELSEKNFEQIQSQNVIIIGMGGIGCPVAKYLVSSGIKNLTIIDLEIERISLIKTQKSETMSLLRKNKGNFKKFLKRFDTKRNS